MRTLENKKAVLRCIEYDTDISTRILQKQINEQLIRSYHFRLPNRLNGNSYLNFLTNYYPALIEDVALNFRKGMWYMHVHSGLKLIKRDQNPNSQLFLMNVNFRDGYTDEKVIAMLDEALRQCSKVLWENCINHTENLIKNWYEREKVLDYVKNTNNKVNAPIEEKPIADVTLTCEKSETTLTPNGSQENKLKNTFGWARIDVIGLLICCVLLASFSFSIVIEALQTLVHIDHHDEMHHAIPVFFVGIAGLILNSVCYFLIGGYTFHQGSFLYMNEEGCVVLNRVVTDNSVSRGERRLSRTRTMPPPHYRQRQGCREMCRDIIGCIFVITCAVVVYFTERNMAKFIDPVLSILSAVILMILSFPYMKESCLILLQTIPDTINIESLRSQLIEHFPEIVNIHDLHVWQLTATKVISTAHIIFQNPHVYAKIMSKVTEFFQEYGITQVTIQPEFFIQTNDKNSIETTEIRCLMHCQSDGCKTSHCCPEDVPNV
ncbi:hypothetical protein FQA39_LY15202 [Lamprigera yunnana]|nr:hypothetical protein FQA39_LY15202 [Lamprigera yunnana]